MKLVLENIGMLKSAELNLDSLSVISGENDNGKSTVGKVVFCIVKAINRYKEDLQESKEYKVSEKLDEIYFDLRRVFISISSEAVDVIRRVNYLRDWSLNLDEKLDILKEQISELKSSLVEDSRLESICKQLEELERMSSEPENTKKSIENALNKVFASEFDSSVLLSGESEGFIKLYDNDLKLIDIKVSVGNKIKLLSEVEPVEFNDATFIESPLILNNHDLLIRSQSGLNITKRGLSRLGMPYTTLHVKDLFDKLKELPLNDIFSNNQEDLLFRESIHNIVSGEIVYDVEKKDFVFNKDDKYISIKNTASGIKVFGLLQLLSNNGFLNKNSVLIFDEPENHLHPKWQLKLAKILAGLAKNGVYILVSSHSPYMIEALKRYSDCIGLEQKTGFYLAEKNVIENRNRLEDTFRILSEPFEIFREMDEEILKDE